MLHRLRLLPVALLLGAAPLGAQSPVMSTELHPGARVRIDAPGIVADGYTGTVLTRTADTLTVGDPRSAPMTLPITRITSLEISRGKSRSAGALRGILIGAPIGLAIGLVSTADGTTCTSCDESAASVVALFTLSGAVWGAGIGAIVGRERWVKFQLPIGR